MRRFGLIGKSLQHSFSKTYFEEKFFKETIKDAEYDLFELREISELPALIKSTSELRGLNVTIPYKEEVLPFLDEIDESAKRVGAANTISIAKNGSLKGFNTDYLAFKMSLENWLETRIEKALILGTGGAAKAVQVALEDLGINYSLISRKSEGETISYEELKTKSDLLKNSQLIVNATPLGTSPNIEGTPDINFELLNASHHLYDLVYNPEETLFMKKGRWQRAKTKNGLEMLYLQAEKSWEIWNSN